MKEQRAKSKDEKDSHAKLRFAQNDGLPTTWRHCEGA